MRGHTYNMAEGSNGNISFKAVWKKNIYDVSFPPDTSVATLKTHIQSLTGIPPAMMKLMYKGMQGNNYMNLFVQQTPSVPAKTLEESKVTAGIKVMVIGSTINDVIAVQPPDPKELKQSITEDTDSPHETLSETTQHKKIIEKGKPEDSIPGVRHSNQPLPSSPLSGLVNKYGAKVRLHFKLEQEQLWIGTKERTEKLPLNSIRDVLSEPIKGHEEYHIMALQLGPTENSRYWIYWVPSQYVESIKDAILGKWQYF